MKILLIDDHCMFRQGMKFLLADLDERLEFSEAGTCEEAIASLNAVGADLILLDLIMPGVTGLTALRQIREAFSAIPLAIVSSIDDPVRIRELIEEGASGYVPKSSSSEVLIAALKLIIAGGVYLPPAVLDFALDPHRGDMVDRQFEAKLLSSRQTAVLLKAIQGIPNKVIARELHIAEGTVKAHLSAAFRMLGVHNRTEAVFATARLGLKPLPFDQS
jgi:two-component system, NarL family, nitrate/nitrite response regulator NarL